MEQKTITELRRLITPPAGVPDVLTAFLVLLDYPTNDINVRRTENGEMR
jgi:hypothetical protein